MAISTHPVTYAFLFPLAPEIAVALLRRIIDDTALAVLRSVAFGSPKHFAIIEICRRACKRAAMDRDRAGKQLKRSEETNDRH